MTPEQKVAFIYAMCINATAKIEAMKAHNAGLASNDYSTRYGAAEFEAVPYNLGLDHNSICSFFED